MKRGGFVMAIGAASLLLTSVCDAQTTKGANRSTSADPHVTALRDLWGAASRNDQPSFARRVAPGATLRIERVDGGFAIPRIRKFAMNCTLAGTPQFNHPKPGDPHYGKPFTSWASADLRCKGLPAADYHVTVWFDEDGRVSSGDLLKPVPTLG